MIDKIQKYLIKYYNYLKRLTQNVNNEVSWKLFNNTSKLKNEFVNWIFKNNFNPSKDFVPLTDKNVIIDDDLPKLITFYLPQYYENETNNKNFGKGFMEWYNVTKCIPQFTGHYQPHLPIDVGFYNLTHDDIMYRQIELAKKYGIYGFCFYYYWFSGDRLLEKPLENFLNNQELNIPFCLFWANETWTHLWDNGNHRDIIKKQELLDDDDDKFAKDILKYFNDSRYIKIGKKPLLIIYKSEIFERDRFKSFIRNLRKIVKQAGFEDIYLMVSDESYQPIDLNYLGIDSVVEFTYKYLRKNAKLLNLKNKYVNPYFKGRVLDVKAFLNDKLHLHQEKYKTHKSVCANWDNSARKAYSGAEIFYMSPAEFELWLNDSIKWTRQNLSKDEQIVFIDSWNEWAEGAHLEPDQKYGYAYLQKVMDVLGNFKNNIDKDKIVVAGISINHPNRGVSALLYGHFALLENKYNFDTIYSLNVAKKTYEKQCTSVINGKRFQFKEMFFDWKLFILALFQVPFIKDLKNYKGNKLIEFLADTQLYCVSNGGDGFTDIYGLKRLFLEFLYIFVPELMKIKTVFTPQTIGPFNTIIGKIFAFLTLKNSSKIFTRDDRADIFLKKIGVKSLMEYDLSVHMQPEIIPDLLIPQNSIGLNISGTLYYKTDLSNTEAFNNYNLFVENLIKFLTNNGWNVILIPHTYNTEKPYYSDDLLAIKEIAEKLNYNNIYVIDKNYTAPQLKYIVSKTEFMISSRMHANLAALSTSTPTVGLAYSYKFAGTFSRFEVEDCVIDIQNIGENDFKKS